MRTHYTLMAATLGLLVAGGLSGSAQTRTRVDAATVDDIHGRLVRLPYYGVFDAIAFSYEKGTVTLSGFAAHGTLPQDAERAVRQVARVDEVINRIEVLPLSEYDDELRWRTYYAIYGDPFLSRYAPGGGVLPGRRNRLGLSPLGARTRFPGMYPTGNYPIQIIVRLGSITLMGTVDSEGDKTLAGMRARSVPGAFSVENELVVERSAT